MGTTSTRAERAWVEVDLGALVGNAERLLGYLPAQTRLLPMVKADAYGLGLVPVAAALARALGRRLWGLGVAAVEEAAALRAAGWTGRILVCAPVPPSELGEAARLGVRLAVSDVITARRWSRWAQRLGRPLALHVEIDTGMGRAGLPWRAAARWGAALRAALAEGGAVWEGTFTHFHSADAPDLAATDEQWRRFRWAVARLPAGAGSLAHVANSAAAWRRAGYGLPLVRPGIFLYGGDAGPGTPTTPVVSVRARVVRVARAAPGDTVGYGAEHRAPAPQRWATVAIGYGDGYRRASWPAGAHVLLHGRPARLLGRVSMDMIVVDVTDLPTVRPGDVATILGRDGDAAIGLADLARWWGTIDYEVLTGWTRRLPRIYRGGDDDAGPSPSA